MHQLFVFLSAFAASAVEMVEALTVVLAAGVTRGWRSTLLGAAAGLAVLAIAIAALGTALSSVPLGALRVVVGSLLLVFGLQWLRKAVLRAAGLKAGHDEAAIFDAARAEIAQRGGGPTSGTDWYAFTISFKAVLLEGLEVAFIVITFGGAQRDVGLAALAAATAFVIVGAVGAAVRGPLTRVPENALKFGVGVMLTAFGTFWAAEGAGAAWPGNDASLPVLVAVAFAMALVAVRALRVTARAEAGGAA
ncbi:MAG TPA: hypothetical protein VMU14_19485 [Acidimicrobiales bacterium]|nr:hypothetical protein [Acidimicrobiales bacterium]